MQLPTVEVVEVHYWAVLIRDEFKPLGEEYPLRHENEAQAEAQVQRFIDKKLATRRGV